MRPTLFRRPSLVRLLPLAFPATAAFAQSRPAVEPFELLRLASPAGNRLMTVQEIESHVQFLAGDDMEGREAGMPGADRAAEFVAERFREAALTPAGDEGRPYQEFTLPLVRVLGKDNRASIRGPNGTVSFLLSAEHMIPLSHTGAGDAYGTVAFAGFGISDPAHGWDDYAGIDARGKVVLVMRGSPARPGVSGELTKKIYAAKEKGAVGIIVVEVPPRDELAPPHLPSYRPTSYDAGIPAVAVRYWPLRSAIPSFFSLAEAVRSGGKPAPVVIENVTARIHVEVEASIHRARNVLGLIKGHDPALRDEVIVIGAHYDHLGLGGEGSLDPDAAGQVHNGADDNASGTAVLMALAPALASRRQRLRRSILLVAFSAEEKGLLGSKYFLEHPPVPKDRIVAMLNMDMVGRSKDGSVLVIGTGTSTLWPRLFAAISPDGKVRSSERSIGGSDHQPFISAGIPAVHFFTGVHEDYHRPTDDVAKLNFAHTLDVAKVVFDTAAHLALMEVRPDFRAQPASPHANLPATMPGSDGVAAGPRPYLGSIPSYEDGSGGLKLDGVTKDSPAEKAGLMKGDTVVELAGRKIDNIYDYQYALSACRPGDEVEIKVKRGGELVPLKVKLGRRGE